MRATHDIRQLGRGSILSQPLQDAPAEEGEPSLHYFLLTLDRLLTALARPAPPQLLLTPDEAAKALSVDRSTIYRLLQSSEFGSIVVGARARRIPLGELQKFVSRRLEEGEGR